MFGGDETGFGPAHRDYCQTPQNKTAIDDCQRKEDREIMIFFLVVVFWIPAVVGVLWAVLFCCEWLEERYWGGKVETGGDEEAGVDEKTALLGNEKV